MSPVCAVCPYVVDIPPLGCSVCRVIVPYSAHLCLTQNTIGNNSFAGSYAVSYIQFKAAVRFILHQDGVYCRRKNARALASDGSDKREDMCPHGSIGAERPYALCLFNAKKREQTKSFSLKQPDGSEAPCGLWESGDFSA